jgi:DNA-binding transcriptional ArsR family regulator
MATSTFPFACVPDAAIWKLGISSHAKVLFNALLACRNRRTKICNISLKKLVERLGISLSTIRRALNQLRRAGMVIVRRSLFGNRYEIATPDKWGPTMSRHECALTDGQCATLTDERTQRSRVSAQEPDVLEPEEQGAALLLLSADREEATTTTPAAGGAQPETPTPPAPVIAPAVTPLLAQGGREPNNGVTEGSGSLNESPVVHKSAEEEAEKLVTELLPYHPWKGNRPWAVKAIAKVLDQDPGAADQIRRSHIAMRPHWEIEQSLSPGKFRPPLGQWIEEGNWKAEAAPPAERKDIKRETWQEQRRREQKESDEQFYRMYAEREMWDALREYGGDELVEAWREKIKTEQAA